MFATQEEATGLERQEGIDECVCVCCSGFFFLMQELEPEQHLPQIKAVRSSINSSEDVVLFVAEKPSCAKRFQTRQICAVSFGNTDLCLRSDRKGGTAGGGQTWEQRGFGGAGAQLATVLADGLHSEGLYTEFTSETVAD